MNRTTSFNWIELLNHTSRSFAVGIQQLQSPLSERVGYSYLLCRLLDTIEDSTHVSLQLRMDALAFCQELLRHYATEPSEVVRRIERWDAVVRPDEWPDIDPWEARLLAEAPLLLRACAEWPAPYREALTLDVGEMADGMRQELELAARGGRKTARTIEETDRYCYYVAGTVGLLLTRFFAAELREHGVTLEVDDEAGIGLGKALQLVNILKDFHEDWREGRCYWPNIAPPTGGPPPPESELRASLELLVGAFRRHAANGERYLDALRATRHLRPDIYGFCAFPLRLAELTVDEALKDLSWLGTGQAPQKVPRARTEALLRETVEA